MATRKPSLAAAAALALIAGCASPPHNVPPAATGTAPAAPRPVAKVQPPAMTDTRPREYPGIHNAVAYHPGFISGGAPEGDSGFDTLAAMGVKTIISVDGAEPDVAGAKARGMKYIHLPIGYNGFDEARRLQLTRATRDAIAEGPVYLHCHHGKHRSAGAAASVAASLGWLDPQTAVARMKVSGTSPNYTGLYACAERAGPLPAAAIDAVPADFPEVWKPAGFVKGMVEIDEVHEHLLLIRRAGWKAPADHPDLVPAAEAGRLADLYRALLAGHYAQRKSDDFNALLKRGMDEAQDLEDRLAAPGAAPDPAWADAQMALITATCKDCHVRYRDVPLDEGAN
ncbi:MAG: hypothetical protein ACK4WH_04585 [Phycisphaerales bacterium]